MDSRTQLENLANNIPQFQAGFQGHQGNVTVDISDHKPIIIETAAGFLVSFNIWSPGTPVSPSVKKEKNIQGEGRLDNRSQMKQMEMMADYLFTMAKNGAAGFMLQEIPHPDTKSFKYMNKILQDEVEKYNLNKPDSEKMDLRFENYSPTKTNFGTCCLYDANKLDVKNMPTQSPSIQGRFGHYQINNKKDKNMKAFEVYNIHGDFTQQAATADFIKTNVNRGAMVCGDFNISDSNKMIKDDLNNLLIDNKHQILDKHKNNTLDGFFDPFTPNLVNQISSSNQMSSQTQQSQNTLQTEIPSQDEHFHGVDNIPQQEYDEIIDAIKKHETQNANDAFNNQTSNQMSSQTQQSQNTLQTEIPSQDEYFQGVDNIPQQEYKEIMDAIKQHETQSDNDAFKADLQINHDPQIIIGQGEPGGKNRMVQFLFYNEDDANNFVRNINNRLMPDSSAAITHRTDSPYCPFVIRMNENQYGDLINHYKNVKQFVPYEQLPDASVKIDSLNYEIISQINEYRKNIDDLHKPGLFGLFSKSTTDKEMKTILWNDKIQVLSTTLALFNKQASSSDLESSMINHPQWDKGTQAKNLVQRVIEKLKIIINTFQHSNKQKF